ncbi:MAG: GGDEF domain-containing protein [Burkholderiales bacterium]|nr:GGDEF domain-containing protein [Burkholderiales bacterium]
MGRQPLLRNSQTQTQSAGGKGKGVHSKPTEILSIEQEELRGVSRTVAEIEWLLLILVLLYQVFEGPLAADQAAISAGLFFYAAFVLSFRYTNFYKSETRWKIALETFGMVLFITWVLWYTGKLASPLVNTYLLVIITSALTLGKFTTMLEMALIAACFMLLGEDVATGRPFSLAYLSGMVAQLAPMLLVAYITTMFSADIRSGLNRARLLSETDDLTGLYNMRGFSIVAARLFDQAIRYNRPVSLLMIDADNLKSVNDRHGHEAGNRLLRLMATCIQTELRHTDVLARYGGDEFVALLPEASATRALEVAQRIIKAVDTTPLEFEGKRIDSSVSIGLACYPDDGRSIDAIQGRADRAMYRAKEQGRNRAVRFSV